MRRSAVDELVEDVLLILGHARLGESACLSEPLRRGLDEGALAVLYFLGDSAERGLGSSDTVKPLPKPCERSSCSFSSETRYLLEYGFGVCSGGDELVCEVGVDFESFDEVSSGFISQLLQEVGSDPVVSRPSYLHRSTHRKRNDTNPAQIPEAERVVIASHRALPAYHSPRSAGDPMKRVWLGDSFVVDGSMVATWDQSWGVSRNQRTGAWTVYDRRDNRRFNGSGGRSWIRTCVCEDADSAVARMLDEGCAMDPDELLAAVTGIEDSAMRDIEAAVRRWLESK